MKSKSLLGMLAVLCCIFTIGMSMAPQKVQGQNREKSRHLPTKEVYTGTVAAIGGQFGGASRRFTLEITGYTLSEEARQDFEILRTRGQDDFKSRKTISPRRLESHCNNKYSPIETSVHVAL